MTYSFLWGIISKDGYYTFDCPFSRPAQLGQPKKTANSAAALPESLGVRHEHLDAKFVLQRRIALRRLRFAALFGMITKKE